MKNHPFFKALLAEGYILLFALGIWVTGSLMPANFQPGPVPSIVTFLSAFVLSAACMGYLFLGEPIVLALDGRTNDGVRYFLRTVAYFAVLAAVTVAIVLIATFAVL